MAQVDVFSFAGGVVALLLAAGLLVAFAINRRMTSFVWWAGSFVLLGIALATATMRFNTPAPIEWVKWLSWGSFYAAACLVAYGLYRRGATRSPMLRIAVGAALFLIIATTLTVLKAPSHYWFVIAPLPTLLFMSWSAVKVFRTGAWGYGLALVWGIAAVVMQSLLHPGGLPRILSRRPPPPPPPPAPSLRAGFGPGSDANGTIALEPGRALFDFRPPPGQMPPVEHPLTVTLIVIGALLVLAVALVLRDLLAELERMRQRSTTDAMTGLLNRATFDEAATALLAEARPYSACMVLFDIDHFKRINDTAGHAAGDQVIARLGQLLRDASPLHGAAGRVGGEEFAIILADSDLGTARLFAEAIRAALSGCDFGDVIGWGVTVSAGIAVHDIGESLHSLTARADKALYAAKAAGRDRIMVAQEPVDRLWQDRQPDLAATA